MEHPWLDFWNKTAETLGVALFFSFLGSAFLLWMSPEAYSPRRGFSVIIAGQIVAAAMTAFLHGYLGVSIYVAPLAGLGCGLLSVSFLLALIRLSNERMGDIVAALVKKVTG